MVIVIIILSALVVVLLIACIGMGYYISLIERQTKINEERLKILDKKIEKEREEFTEINIGGR